VKELGLSEHDVIDLDIVKKEMVSGFGITEGRAPYKREHAAEHEDLW